MNFRCNYRSQWKLRLTFPQLSSLIEFRRRTSRSHIRPQEAASATFPAHLRPDVRLEKVPLKFFFPLPEIFRKKPNKKQNKTKKSSPKVNGKIETGCGGRKMRGRNLEKKNEQRRQYLTNKQRWRRLSRSPCIFYCKVSRRGTFQIII